MNLAWVLLLTAASYGHLGSAANWFGATDTRDQYVNIYVKDCSGRLEPIFSDPEMTTPLPNPFVSNSDGTFLYFSKDKLVKETYRYGDLKGTIDFCRKSKM